MTTTAWDRLSWFEMPRPFIEPTLRALRLANTTLDLLFYDVNVLSAELLSRGTAVASGESETTDLELSRGNNPLRTLDLSALSNPEGSILVVDASRLPYVRPFADVPAFLQYVNGGGQNVKTASVTGVGSSALGSVAFAWNISAALGEPVAAIVPGYGVADVVQQSLGGWFGFGLHSWIKKVVQEVLANTAPQTASIGRGLMMSAPHATANNGAPVFQRGSGSSDVLHAILMKSPNIQRVYGHSKGALVIENAVSDVPAERTDRLQIVTFGCPIGEDTPVAGYLQFLGLIDPLGLLNSWGNRPDKVIPTHHSTNTMIPLSMSVSHLAQTCNCA